MRYLITLGLVIGLLSPFATAYEEDNAIPFDPSFETNLWGIVKQPEWVFSQTLHVDNQSPTASDSNSGSSNSPLMTISRAVDLSSPGTRILIYPGTYRESVTVTPAKSGTTLAPLMLEAKEYGKAVVSGSDVVTDWTQDGNRYYAAWTNDWGYKVDAWAEWGAPVAPLGRRYEMVFVDGVFYWQKLDPASLTPGTFAVDETANRIYIRMADASAPSNHQIEVTKRLQGLSIGNAWDQSYWASNVVIRGMTFQHSEDQCFIGRHVLVEDCKVLWNNGGCNVGGEDYIIRRVTSLFNGILGIGIPPRSSPFDLNGLIENCTTSHGNWRFGKMGGQDGFGMAGMKVMLLSNLVIRGHVSQWNYCPGIWLDYRCNNVLVEDSLVTDNRTQGIWMEISNGEDVIRNNVIANNGTGIMISSTSYLRIYGNILYNNGTQIGNWHQSEVRENFRTVGLKIKDNVIYGPNPVVLPASYASIWSTIEAGGNQYYPTLWTAQGHDVTSTVGDPLFVSPSTMDFNVKSGSPLLMNEKWSFVTPSLSSTGTCSLAANRSGVIRYTLDGSLPVSTSPVYSNSLDLSAFEGDLVARRYDTVLTNPDKNYCPAAFLPVSQGQRNILVNSGFEKGGLGGWAGFGSTITNSSLLPRTGSYCGRAIGRSAVWSGPAILLAGKLAVGETYKISAWVRLESPGSTNIAATIAQTDGSGTTYHGLGSVTATNTAWAKIEGLFTLNVNGTLSNLMLYWSGPEAGVVFYIDDAVCTPVITASQPQVLSTGGSALSTTSATLSGSLTNGSIGDAWVCWGDNDAGTNSPSSWDHAVSVGMVTQGQPFSAVVSGLMANVTYWYRCYVINAAGTDWSDTAASFSGQPVLPSWTPALLACEAWYDAADTNTITVSSGAVSQWRDKSGNGLSLAATTGNPQTGSTINGLNALDFTGDVMSTASNPFGATVSDAFVIAVHKVNSIQQGTLFSLTGTETVGNRWQTHAPFSDGVLYFDCGAAAAPNRMSASYGVSAGNVALASFYCSTAENVQQVYKNGSLLVGDSSGHAVSTGGGNIMIGGVSLCQDSTLGEFIVVKGTVDAATRQKLEGYLAHKWGLQGNLPVNHPYKSAAPGNASGGAILNLAPTGISTTSATFNATLLASGTNYSVYVRYGMSDGGTNAVLWESSAYVGSWTNVASTNISFSAGGLAGGLQYYYTFSASNASTTAWGNQIWSFVTPGTSDTCTLTVNSPHGTSVPDGVTARPSNSVVNVSMVDSPVLVGSNLYTCTGWTGTGSATNGSGVSTSFNITNDTTVSWIWATNTVTLYTVVFDAGTNGVRTGGGALTQQVVEGWAAVAPEITPAAGYTFDGWAAAFDSVSSDMTIQAQYSVIQYTLTYLAGSNGTISGAATQTVAYGNDAAFVTAVPDSGYHFVNWSDSSTLNPRGDANITADLTVTANFALNVPPVVGFSTGAVPVSATSAMLNGVLTAGQTANAWICWGTTDGGTSATSNWEHVVSAGAVTDGVAFSNLVTGLATNRTYFYRCYAENPHGSDWSDIATSFNGLPVDAGVPWTPALMGCAAWYDAADTNTITASSGAVSQWRDKSGNGLNLAARTGNPQTGSVINGLNALDFTGDAMVTATNPFGATVSNAFVITVHRVDSTTGVGDLFSLTGTNTVANRWQGHAPYLTTLYFDCGEVIGANRVSTPYGVSAGSEALTSFYCSTADNVQQVYKNGSLLVGDSTGHAVSTAGNIMVGGVGDCQDTTIGEFIIIKGTVSAATRQKLEGYLAHKWSLQGSLPADHPYKSAAPWVNSSIANMALIGITNNIAMLRAVLSAPAANYDVTVHWGATDGGTNAGAWDSSATVGSWTNAASTNISYLVSGLVSAQTYYYTFRASNTTATVWASPSWTFRTLGMPMVVTTNYSVPYSWLAGINSAWTNDYEAAVTNDADSDGFTTWQEYWSGTDPLNAGSYLKLDSIELTGTNALLKWSHANVDSGLPPITIQARSNLVSGTWGDIGSHTPTNGVNTWILGSSVQGFYRLTVTNAP